MEIIGFEGFFFHDTCARFDSNWRFIKDRFRNIYEDGNGNQQTKFGESFYHDVRTKVENRIIAMQRLATSNNTSVSEIKKLSLYEYHLLIESAIERAQSKE